MKVEEKLETEKSRSESEMLARKDYIPFNRYVTLLDISKYLNI